MKFNMIRSDKIYNKMADTRPDKRTDIFRQELMMPFKGKMDCYGIPMKAKQEGGYDVIMACDRMGFWVPPMIDTLMMDKIKLMGEDNLWARCQLTLEKSWLVFEREGIDVPVKEVLWTILLANPKSPYTLMNQGYSGDGGIPGYIMGSIWPEKETMERLPAVMAHELNHNIRFQFQKWRNDITLGEMIVSEGLAENFAISMCGEEWAGPWVTRTSWQELTKGLLPKLYHALQTRGLEEITAYLYGDEMARLQGYFEVGMPYCAGYACGYHLVQYFLAKTGCSIAQASLLPADEILDEARGFWNLT